MILTDALNTLSQGYRVKTTTSFNNVPAAHIQKLLAGHSQGTKRWYTPKTKARAERAIKYF